MSKYVTTTADLKRWGFVEQPDGSWKKPNPAALDRLATGKHTEQAGALERQAQAPRSGKTRRAQSSRKRNPASNRQKQPCEAVVMMVAYLPTYFDTDNLAGALKPIRDEVADWLGIDDGDYRVQWECEQVKTQGSHGVSVKVERLAI